MQGQAAIERNKMNGTDDDETIFMTGVKLLTALEYNIDAEVITKIEPFVQTSYLIPDTKKVKYHMIQADIGANFYFTKKIRLRFDGNLIFTKNDLNEDYVTNESLVTLELQVRF